MSRKATREFCIDFFEYDTPMMVHIKNRTVGIINRFVQFIVLAYIVLESVLHERGYQEFDDVQSAVTTKLKGVLDETNSSFGHLTWDVADYVIPPLEESAFFVMTSVIVTRMQTQMNCSENPKFKEAWCETDDDCQIGLITPTGNGPFTGRCIESDIPSNHSVCEIYGWCPVEDDREEMLTIFEDSENFTVLIKNHIEFPKFNFKKRNILEWYRSIDELLRCRWNPDDPRDKYCPVFVLGDISRRAGAEYSSLLTKGAIIQIIIDWNCDLDFSAEYCMPEYSFHWLDSGNYTLSLGFNFRHANHFFMREDDGNATFYRNLYKAFGVHFLVEVRGRAGKFHFVNTILTLGSGVSLLGISSILSDIVVLYFLKARKMYQRKKFQVVDAGHYESLQGVISVMPDKDGQTIVTIVSDINESERLEQKSATISVSTPRVDTPGVPEESEKADLDNVSERNESERLEQNSLSIIHSENSVATKESGKQKVNNASEKNISKKDKAKA